MHQRVLGESGLEVSAIGLGCMGLSANYGEPVDEAAGVALIRAATDLGVTFFDTADVYSAGVSEEIVGQALQGQRDAVFLATKFFMPMSDNPNERGGSRRWIIREAENSLRRLAP
jgi:aryl-alcohol dehydrogenase-like predicted oxidoreductase